MQQHILKVEGKITFRGEILECIHAAIDAGYTRLLKTSSDYSLTQVIDDSGQVATIELVSE